MLSMARQTSVYHSHQSLFVRFGTIVKQMFKIAILDYNWRRAFESLSVDSKADLLTEALLNIFRNYISNKKIKFDKYVCM